MLHVYMLMTRMADRLKSEEGAGMAEYTLLLVLVAVALVTAFTGLKDAIATALSGVVTDLGN